MDADDHLDDSAAALNDRDRQIAYLLRLAGPRPQPPAARAARVRAAVHAEWQQVVRDETRRRFRGWIVGSLAAAAMLALVVGSWWLRGRDLTLPGSVSGPIVAAEIARTIGDVRTQPDDKTIHIGGAIETGPTGRAALVLTRGASIRLDHDTRLVFEAAAVIRLERGAVYIDSGARHEEASALQVLTPLGPVRDIGTQFEVRLDGDALEVQVREGAVAFDDARAHDAGARDARTNDNRAHADRSNQNRVHDDPAQGNRLHGDRTDSNRMRDLDRAQMVTRGEAVSIARGRAPIRRTVLTYGDAWDWILNVATPFELEGRSLSQLLDWAAREQGWRWQFADPATARRAKEVVLHGSIEGLTPAEAIDAVLPTCGMTSHLDRDLLTIRAARSGRN